MMNPTKGKIVQIVNKWLQRSSLSVSEAVSRMQTLGCDITRNQFENRFTTRLNQLTPIDEETFLALVEAFTQSLSTIERCKAGEAIELALLLSVPLDALPRLRTFFSDNEYNQAFADFWIRVDPRLEATLKPEVQLHSLGTHPSKPTHSTPIQDGSPFVGRKTEIRRLQSLIHDTQCQVILIVGAGGIGKTTLANHLVMRSQEDFAQVVRHSWLNPQPIDYYIQDMVDFLGGNEANHPPVQDGLDLMTVLLEKMSRQRYLIYIDNLETAVTSDLMSRSSYLDMITKFATHPHQSCVIVTSRELPLTLRKQGISPNTMSVFPLKGMSAVQCRDLVRGKHIHGTDEEWKIFADRYAGNPLAVQIAANAVSENHAGKLSHYIETSEPTSADISLLLESQFQRTTLTERDVLFNLALMRDSIELYGIQQSLNAIWIGTQVLQAVDRLVARQLCEFDAEGRFRLQPMLIEFCTQKIIDQASEDVVTGSSVLLSKHALMRATAKDYIRQAQTQFIISPLITHLRSLYSTDDIKDMLLKLLANRRSPAKGDCGHLAGNVINLLVHLGVDLSGLDFSDTCISEAYLSNVNLSDIDFSRASIIQSRLPWDFGRIHSVGFSGDGRFIVTTSSNGEIRFWDAQTLTHVKEFYGHKGLVLSAALDYEGGIVASGGDDGLLRLWDTTTGQQINALDGHTGRINSVVFSSRKKIVATGSADHTVRLWDVETGSCLQRLLHPDEVLSISLAANQGVLATAIQNISEVWLWDTTTGQKIGELSGHDGYVKSVATSPNGEYVVSGGTDGTVRLWELSSLQCLKTFAGHTSDVESVAFSSDGRFIASGSLDARVLIWSVFSESVLHTVNTHDTWVKSVAFQPKGRVIISGGDDQRVCVTDYTNGSPLYLLQGYDHRALCTTYLSPQGKVIVGYGDGSVRMWSMNHEQDQTLLIKHETQTRSLVVLEDRFVYSGDYSGSIVLWDTKKEVLREQVSAHNNHVHTLLLHPTRDYIISASNDGFIKAWEPSLVRCLWSFRPHSGHKFRVAFSNDGRRLFTVGHEQAFSIWDVENLKRELYYDEVPCNQWYLTPHPIENIAVTGGDDGYIYIWDINTCTILRALKAHERRIRCLAFHPDGAIMASGGQDNVVRIWGWQNSELLHTLSGHSEMIHDLAFSQDGKNLASVSYDGSLNIWDISSGHLVDSFSPPRPCKGMLITDVKDLSSAQREALLALGAKE